MKFRNGLLIAPIALALAGVHVGAAAKPSAAEVSQARASCAAEKQRVQSLESKAGDNAPALETAKEKWETACNQATLLIDARDGKVNPQPSGTPSTGTTAMESAPPDAEATTPSP